MWKISDVRSKIIKYSFTVTFITLTEFMNANQGKNKGGGAGLGLNVLKSTNNEDMY